MHDTLTHDHSHPQTLGAVIPTAEKLGASGMFTGRGVTIAFLDSGFYPHPDIIDRVAAFHDVHGAEGSITEIDEPKGYHWHGTQTVVACAGDGNLSDGVYRGVASDARLVLVKVSDNGRISDESIEKGLRWVIENRERYGIRILNMSLGGDADLATRDSCVNQLAELLVELGVVITVAAGNSAETRPIPPANAPSVITVGGYSDENQFQADGFELYHSSYGETADGHLKPEIVAPAMYVAAPILPGTTDYLRAEALSRIAAEPDYGLPRLMAECWEDAGLTSGHPDLDPSEIRAVVTGLLERDQIVSTHYKHVDGTSFAAPITASVIAQMIEANPKLTPVSIKNILISTASRLSGHPSVRQGYGVLNAAMAVESAMAENHYLDRESYFPPRVDGRRIVFCYHDDSASSVALCGDFNDWHDGTDLFEQNRDGLWYAAIPCQAPGTYRYKFLIDGIRWVEDPSHGVKADDGHGGFNSILSIV